MTSPSSVLTSLSSPALQPPELRILLDSTLSRGTLDGAWWPRSKNPVVELPALINGLAEQVGPITRVALNVTAWDSNPKRIVVGGRTVRLGWFTVLDPDTVSLTRSRGEHIDLLVVPPESGSFFAVTAMAMAADSQNMARPAAILVASQAITRSIAVGPPPPESYRDEDTVWETDGGWVDAAVPATRKPTRSQHAASAQAAYRA
jgi:Family of unknown function (DUF5994)